MVWFSGYYPLLTFVTPFGVVTFTVYVGCCSFPKTKKSISTVIVSPGSNMEGWVVSGVIVVYPHILLALLPGKFLDPLKE